MSNAIALRPIATRVLGTLIAFAAALGVFALVNGTDPDAGAGAPAALDARAPAAGEPRIAELQSAVAADPTDAAAATLLGDAYYLRARETGEPGFYERADRAYRRGARDRPGRSAGADRRRDPGARAPRLPPGPGARRARPCRGAWPAAPLSGDRRRPDRARPLRRRRPHPRPAGDPEAEPGRLRARLLFPRAHRRPRRRPAGDAPRGLVGGRRRVARLRADADGWARAHPRQPRRGRGRLPRRARGQPRLLAGARRTRTGRRRPRRPRRGDRRLPRGGRAPTAARVRDRARRGRARRRPRRGGGAGPGPGPGRGAAAAGLGRQRRRRAGAVRGRPRRSGPRGRARPRGLAGGAGGALGRRALLGLAQRRRGPRRARLLPRGDAPRVGRSDLPLPRRGDRGRRRAHRARAPLPDRGGRAHPRLQPLPRAARTAALEGLG